MKLAVVKRILALSLCVALFTGDSMLISAETVSDGDSELIEQTIEEEPTEETTEEFSEEPTEETTEDSLEEPLEEESEDILEDTVSGGDLVEIENEEVPLDDSMIVSLEAVTVDGVTITVSGPASAFAEGTTVSAEVVEIPDAVIEAMEESEQAIVKQYKAFDVSLICDGKVVEPLNGAEITVDFEGDLLVPEEGESSSFYHMGEDDKLTKVDA